MKENKKNQKWMSIKKVYNPLVYNQYICFLSLSILLSNLLHRLTIRVMNLICLFRYYQCSMFFMLFLTLFPKIGFVLWKSFLPHLKNSFQAPLFYSLSTKTRESSLDPKLTKIIHIFPEGVRNKLHCKHHFFQQRRQG